MPWLSEEMQITISHGVGSVDSGYTLKTHKNFYFYMPAIKNRNDF